MAKTTRVTRALNGQGTGRFGTFGGVFTPSILTVFGVIMFMRCNYVVARAGVGCALLTLVLCKFITLLTGLSIAGISTNTRIRGGGAYFMISRVLGPEFGGAIGLALFFAQALSVPFYILGFTEALTSAVPATAPYFLFIGLAVAASLFALTWVGAHWAIRAQYFILAVMVASILTFLIGAAESFRVTRLVENFKPTEGYRFWVILAIYFPAVTGIMAGVNMSGDLKSPARSIPLGTFAAIGVGFVVYALQMVILGGAAPRGTLEAEPFRILLDKAFLGMAFLVTAGVFAATLSSAIGSLMGAPRVLQALARDRIFRALEPFGKGVGEGAEPRRAATLTFGITLVVLLLSGKGGGALNAVAAVVTMFFLYTYGMTNLAAFVESFGLNPSFRPRFRYFHWLTALAGAAGCLGVAFLISPLAALAAALVVAGLYYSVARRTLQATFGDARRGFVFSRIRRNLLTLRTLPVHPKNWRPTVLALSGNPRTRPNLLHFGDWFEGGRGILTIGEVLVGEFEDLRERRRNEIERLEKDLLEQDTAAFPEVVAAPTLDQGIMGLLQAHSIGPLKPNLTLFGWTNNPERESAFERNLRTAYGLGMSVIVLRAEQTVAPSRTPRIDVWWRGRENGYLMLILTHLLTRNWEWRRGRTRVLRMVENEAGGEPAREALEELTESARIDADVEVVVSPGPFRETLRAHSSDADLVLLGFRIPEDPEAPVFAPGFEETLRGSPAVLLVCSTGEADPRE